MLLIVAGLLLTSAQALPNRTFCDDRWKATRPLVEDLRAGREIGVTVADGLPPYHFHILADPDCGGIRKLEVRTPAGLLLQTLTMDDSEAPFIGSKFFVTEDLNFDGFLDVRCLAFWGATGNELYSIWLFEPTSHLFVQSAELNRLGNRGVIGNLSVNTKRHEITISRYGGMAKNIYGHETYKWRAGHLVLVSSEDQDWDPKTRCFVLQRLPSRAQRRREESSVILTGNSEAVEQSDEPDKVRADGLWPLQVIRGCWTGHRCASRVHG